MHQVFVTADEVRSTAGETRGEWYVVGGYKNNTQAKGVFSMGWKVAELVLLSNPDKEDLLA